jgi:acetyl-CoA synthetase
MAVDAAGHPGDPERYRQAHLSRSPGLCFAGDGAKRDEHGRLWLPGRVDDVMSMAGHRSSTIEVESIRVDHQAVAAAAVVGEAYEISGQAILAFVILEVGREPSDALSPQLREHVAYVIGPIARPRYLPFTPDLPRTRSGKTMRRLPRDIAEGRALGDTTTLADATVVAAIREQTGRVEED